jgi:hypothetical protein
MIAVVHNTKSAPGGMTAEMRKFAEDAIAQARSFDGCEAVISASDPGTGDSVTVNVFRDEAAMRAFQEMERKLIAEAGTLGAEVDAGRTYSDVIARL